MIEIILLAIGIAMTAVFFANYNDPYLWVIDKLKMKPKPWQCSKCLGWWLGFACTIFMYSHLAMLLLAPMSALLAIAIEKLMVMLSAYL
ncbi:hypothetical protein [Sphingobacterium sp. 1.A.5]|uniref:hypothetical protein n=1 Tax=Sphingobacterium sp. 1.A.5 TaxID=2044604 RepID=UPI000C0BEC58|nr:hypothetical protein [Sphingobacterium sp. 1.A.5]